MKIGIIGGREFKDEALVQRLLDETIAPYEDDCTLLVFLGGGSKGAERIAQDHITGNLKWDYVLFEPYNFLDRKVPHDPKHFYFRNKQIVNNSDLVLVFDDGVEASLPKIVTFIKKATQKNYIIFFGDGSKEERR